MLSVFAILLPCSASTAEKWVHGSWVNVRETVETQSVVIEHVTTNTKVDVVAEQGKTCEIVWGEAKRGFVPCGLLGEKALTLKEVMVGWDYYRLESLEESLKRNPNYSPVRAFWIAPSAEALFAVGEYFEQTLLSRTQQNLEHGRKENGEDYCPDSPGTCYPADFKPPKLVRYPVPEFEAMKALLAQGIVVAAPTEYPPLLTCQQILTDERDNDHSWHIFSMKGPHISVTEACNYGGWELFLPTIRPSFFKNNKDILPGNVDIEQISFHFGIVERGRVTRTPSWKLGYCGQGYYSGAWDIGRYELTLDKPVVEHVIGRNGQVGAYQWTQQQHSDEEWLICDSTPLLWQRRGKTLLSGTAIKDADALFWFQTPAALPFQNVKISQRTLDKELFNEVYEIDFDSDGIVDFVYLENRAVEMRLVIVNINGEWFPFEWDEHLADCQGCC
jgi:hypothetical protein